jgi:hypothetical protein
LTATPAVTPDASALEELLLQMWRIRSFELRAMQLFEEKLIRGSVHPYIGMEAIAVGACSALRPTDYITSTHRGHGHCIAKNLELRLMMAEILGREAGYCRGKGGSMHITAVDHGMLGADAIVCGSSAIAVGAAYGLRIKGEDGVVVCFFGDGASNQGLFHEAANDAPTPVGNVPALTPERLALAIVATPKALVVADPTATPFIVNAIVFPLTGDPAALSVADTTLVPPYTPLAAAADSVVAVSSVAVIVVGSLTLLLPGVTSPPPLTVTWFVTLGGAALATVTVTVTAG